MAVLLPCACGRSKPAPLEDEDTEVEAADDVEDQAGDEAEESDVAPAPTEDSTGSFDLIPPKQGTFDEMWMALRGRDEIYMPVMDLELPEDPTMESYRTVKFSQLRHKLLYIQRTAAGTSTDLHAVYTDATSIDPGNPYRPVQPIAYLKWALSDSSADGVFFNPLSRVCSKCDRNRAFGINGFGVAELIGYLQAPPDDGTQPYSELAAQAENRGQHFQVLSYAGRSFREPRVGDDWKKAELSKLRAYWTLDFPRSRARAVSELEWFIKEHGATPERRELLSWFKARR